MTQGDKVLGIIFPNMHDEAIPELTQLRTMASVPYGGRYRMIDFTLSAMVKAGINNVCLIPRKNYISLMDHVGTGKEWDLARKIGGLKIFPPFGEAGSHRYKGKIEALDYIKKYIESSPCDTVILADCGIVSAVNYADLLKRHAETGASVTIVYKKGKLDRDEKNDNITLQLNKNRVTEIYANDSTVDECNVCMWCYVLSKTLLMKIIDDCTARGLTHFEKDVLRQALNYIAVYGYEYTGYMKRVTSLKSYYKANLDLLNKESMDMLFGQYPIYTKVRDDAPVRYAIGSKVKKIIAGDGCYIEGDVQNSVLFRGVKIGKGAVVKGCILLQDTVVEDGAVLENVICDKGVVITKEKRLIGAESHPVYVEKKVIV